MRTAVRWHRPSVVLLALTAMLAIVGCSSSGSNSIDLTSPVEQGNRGSVSGTLYAIANGTMDLPGNIPVTLTPAAPPPSGGTWPPAGSWPRTTVSNVTGSYQFADVPIGTYKIAVEDTVNSTGMHIAGELSNVVVKGGIPTLNTNLLLGKPDDMVTFTGTVKQNNQLAAGATVTMEVVAKPFPYNEDDDQRAMYISTTTDVDGVYTITVPNMQIIHEMLDGNNNPILDGDGKPIYIEHYAITAHSTTSDIPDPAWYYPPILNSPVTVSPIVLNTVSKPIATAPTALYLMSVSLPAPTMEASLQAAVSRLTVARATGAPASRIATLQKMAQGRQQAMTRGQSVKSAIGMVENDLNWEALNQSLDVQGYRIYRAPADKGKFTKVGTTTDPYDNVFVDNDPALPTDKSTYYVITSFAANGVESPPTPPVVARPLPGLTNVRTETVGALPLPTTTASDKIRLRWDPVYGARGYIVMLYTNQPSFNTLPEKVQLLSEVENSYTFSYPTGYGDATKHYWWTVSAFNVNVMTTPAWAATSAAYSAFYQFDLRP